MILYDDQDQDQDDQDDDAKVDLYETGEGGAGKFSTAEPWPPVHLSTLGCTTFFVSKFKIFILKLKNICQKIEKYLSRNLNISMGNFWPPVHLSTLGCINFLS